MQQAPSRALAGEDTAHAEVAEAGEGAHGPHHGGRDGQWIEDRRAERDQACDGIGMAGGQRPRQGSAAALSDHDRRAVELGELPLRRVSSRPAQPTLTRMPLPRTRWPRRRSQPAIAVREASPARKPGIRRTG